MGSTPPASDSAGDSEPKSLFRSAPDPERFTVSRGTLRVDRFMNRFVVIGGLSVILAVFGIGIFIVAEVLPLFQAPSIRAAQVYDSTIEDPVLMGADEWLQRPFVLSAEGEIAWLDLSGPEMSVQRETLELPEGFVTQTARYFQEPQQLLLGSTDGRYVYVEVNYTPVFAPDGERSIEAALEVSATEQVSLGAIEAIAVNASDTRRTVGIIERIPEVAERRLQLVNYERRRSLFGGGAFTRAGVVDLTDQLPGAPADLLIGLGGEALVVQLMDGRVAYFRAAGRDWNLSQVFSPFGGTDAIASIDFLQGEVSLNLTSHTGENVLYSLTPTETQGLQFVRTKELPPLAGGALHSQRSVRNKAYLMADAETLSLRYATTGKVRWEEPLEEPLVDVLLGEKYDAILTLTESGHLHLRPLRDPHPEAGFRAFFTKIWYEGQDEPRYTWQSTGGTDDFEPKLSLVPLIVGSLKGTFYALLFAVPIALLAAIYTAQFLHPSMKRVIKPTMEIMASLPSVVLGFLGALWLAPILDQRVPSFILFIVAIFGSAMLLGFVWTRLSVKVRSLLPAGAEFLIVVPVLILAGWLGWQLGPAFERLAFSVTDPETGARVSDFRLWWLSATGDTFQQRNSLIVGIMMGFAVIPIIFTIAEDALSNVPQSLISGSLALGASRWQTTARIVIPGASAGIFSALMIGLGRAVGETMIVVMVTGNTPIMDWDIFSGMRTLSANIAVELPEAPHGGTLYRTLFLGALVLFIMTFAVNTVAEFLRQRLRERYKVIS